LRQKIFGIHDPKNLAGELPRPKGRRLFWLQNIQVSLAI